MKKIIGLLLIGGVISLSSPAQTNPKPDSLPKKDTLKIHPAKPSPKGDSLKYKNPDKKYPPRKDSLPMDDRDPNKLLKNDTLNKK